MTITNMMQFGRIRAECVDTFGIGCPTSDSFDAQSLCNLALECSTVGTIALPTFEGGNLDVASHIVESIEHDETRSTCRISDCAGRDIQVPVHPVVLARLTGLLCSEQ